MKVTLAILIGVCNAVSLTGIDVKELHEGNHWRKAWPEGHVDVGDGDSEIIDRFLEAEPVDNKPEVPPHEWHTYEPHTTTLEPIQRQIH